MPAQTENHAALAALSPRERFIHAQALQTAQDFALTEGEDAVRQQFEKMALDTFDALGKTGAAPATGFTIFPDSAANFLIQTASHAHVTADILAQWHAWKEQFTALLDRNPRLALYDLLSALSETHAFESFPHEYSGKILDWVVSGRYSPLPLDDRNNIITPALYARLRHLRQRCGGWLYWSDTENRVVFTPDGGKT